MLVTKIVHQIEERDFILKLYFLQMLKMVKTWEETSVNYIDFHFIVTLSLNLKELCMFGK